MRNVATVGGHLAHGDPHMDLPPVLIALGAQCRSPGRSGAAHDIAVEELFAGYYETVLARDELIAELIVPAQAARRAAYLKVHDARRADDWPALGVAVSFEARRRRDRRRAIVVSAATEKPMRLAAAPRRFCDAAAADDAAFAARRRGGGRGGRLITDDPAVGGLQEASWCASMWRARYAQRSRATAEPD